MSIEIAIPYNITEEAASDEEAIRKIGYVGRAAAIFRVSKIYIYTFGGSKAKEEAIRIKKLLDYLATPPYLRKDLVPLDPDLKLAGLLQPLNLPIYGPSRRELRRGDVRVGLVVRWEGYHSIVKVGDDEYVKVPKPYPIKSIIPVVVEAKVGDRFYRGHVAGKGIYTGYVTEVVGLGPLFNRTGPVILTGKEGRSIIDVLDEVKRLSSENILIMFGSPRMGIDEILRREGLDEALKKHPFINFIPNQGVETVRTEEAIVAVLSIINLLRHQKSQGIAQ